MSRDLNANPPLLELRNLHAGYGESVVLDGLSLVVHAGEVVALLGPNGAGKTTTMRSITGLVRPTAGQVLIDGVDITPLPAHRRVEQGICLSPEGRQVFPNLGVEKNLLLGSYDRSARALRAQTLERIYSMFPKLYERRTQSAGLLSGGEQQMLAIGRALMGQPRMLLLDEPSLGLAPVIVQLVFEAIGDIARSGISILLVEQNANAALAVADRGYVLAEGRIVLSDSAANLSASDSVRQAFLHGGDAPVIRPPGQRPSAGEALADHPETNGLSGSVQFAAPDADSAPMLELRAVRRTFGGLVATNNLSFTVQRGQFLGVIGPNGAGKTTLLNLITGYLRPSSGEVLFEGRRIDGLPPYQVCRRAIGRTFQVVQPFAEMTVADNVLTGVLFAGGRKLSIAQAREHTRRPLQLVGLDRKAHFLAGTLTLGEKKKLELARALATNPRLLLLDEVMAGSTHGEVLELMEVLRDIHAAGTTIVMIEHLVHVILGLAERVIVLNFGEKLAEGAPHDVVADPRVIETYLGRPLERRVRAPA